MYQNKIKYVYCKKENKNKGKRKYTMPVTPWNIPILYSNNTSTSFIITLLLIQNDHKRK